MSLTNTTKAQVLNHLLRFQQWGKPLEIYVALFTASPGPTGDITNEVDGDGYQRILVGPGDQDWDPPVAGDNTFRNAAEVAFAQPLDEWGQLTHFALCSASAGDNLLAYSALDVAISASPSNDPPTFKEGDLRMTLGGHLTEYLALLIGNHMLRSDTWPLTGELYAGLVNELGDEVTGASYERQPALAWSAPDPDTGCYHDDYIVWSVPQEDWGEAHFVSLHDDTAGGNEQMRIPLLTPRPLPEGAIAPNFPPGALTLSVN